MRDNKIMSPAETVFSGSSVTKIGHPTVFCR